jgi:hypothetical protein
MKFEFKKALVRVMPGAPNLIIKPPFSKEAKKAK